MRVGVPSARRLASTLRQLHEVSSRVLSDEATGGPSRQLERTIGRRRLVARTIAAPSSGAVDLGGRRQLDVRQRAYSRDAPRTLRSSADTRHGLHHCGPVPHRGVPCPGSAPRAWLGPLIRGLAGRAAVVRRTDTETTWTRPVRGDLLLDSLTDELGHRCAALGCHDAQAAQEGLWYRDGGALHGILIARVMAPSRVP